LNNDFKRLSTEMGQNEEVELMALISRYDKNAYEIIVDRYMKNVFHFSFSILKDISSAEDITQEVFVRLWNKASTWKPTGKVKSWLLRIAHNLCMSELRKKKEHLDYDEVSAYLLTQESVDQEKIIQDAVVKKTLKEVVLDLPERQRIAVMLVYYAECSNKDAAKTMEVSLEALESLLARPSCHAFHASVTEDISIPPISKMARLYYSDT